MWLFTFLPLALLVLVTSGPFPSAAVKPPACPKGWHLYGHHCYKFYLGPLTWYEAEAECQAHSKSGHLVSVHDPEESAVVTALIKPYKYYDSVWIGLYTSKKHLKGPWWWSDGSTYDYTEWALGEPDYPGKLTYFCVRLLPVKGHWMWNDCDCSTAQAFVCKYAA